VTDSHPDHDRLLALALDDLADPDRQWIMEHLATCHRCRNEYDDLSATIERTLPAAPIADPSPGFDRRVLEAMGLGEETPDRNRSRRTSWRRLAGGVAAGLLVGLGGGYLLGQSEDSTSQTQLAEGSTSLVPADGEQVGTVGRGRLDGDAVLVVEITNGPVGVHYRCRMVLKSGNTVEGDDWTLESPDGGTWVMQAPAEGLVAVELVTDSGDVWSTARL
jgi:hypothetical protein